MCAPSATPTIKNARMGGASEANGCEPKGDPHPRRIGLNSPNTDLHMRSYAELHVRSYADTNHVRQHRSTETSSTRSTRTSGLARLAWPTEH
jgi:hypothetical protein